MDSSKIQELIKKIETLRDLRDAISVVKSTDTEESKEPQKELSKTSTQDNQAPAQKPKMFNHSASQITNPGEHIHHVNIANSPKRYEIHVDTKPHDHIIKVSHYLNDKLQGHSPVAYKNINQAAKSIVKHHFDGDWE